MLHLLPLRLILWAFAFVAAISLGFAFAGLPSDGHVFGNLSALVRWSGSLVTIATVILFAGWRWIRPLQGLVFPYLGGTWKGVVEFENEDGDESGAEKQTRDVTLEVKHLLTGITMMLDSAESTSWTLVVHAEKAKDFDRYRLYYVYLNERKEGTDGAGERYRGLAIIGIKTGTPLRMAGNYFTETDRKGMLKLTQVAANPWWKLWR
jgi:hypothetical protein